MIDRRGKECRRGALTPQFGAIVPPSEVRAPRRHRFDAAAVGLLCACLLGLLPGCGKRETAVQQGNREQILQRGTGGDVTDLDPQTAVNLPELDVASALFEGLVTEDPTDLHPVPGVAEGWDVSDDKLTYTFHLRPTAKWSDGSPVTAADFVASWQRVLTSTLGAENAALLYVIRGAAAFHKGTLADFSQVGVAATDPLTLRVTLEHPTPYFLSLLTHPVWMPVPTATIAKFGSPTDRGNRWTRPGNLVGNGPFTLSTWRPNQEIVVTKSASYWDAAHVRLSAVRFVPFDSVDAEERAFRAGQLHVTYVLPFGKADAYRRDAPQLLRSDAYLDSYFLRLNTRHSPLDDARLRRALSLAIDRTALVQKVLRAGQTPATAITPQGLPNYTPPAGLSTDVAAARRLLADAGHANGAGLPPIEILFHTSENLRVIAEALQEMWRRELGLNVQLVNQEFKVMLSERRLGHYQILLSDWVGDYLDASTFLEPWRSDSPNNHTGWMSQDYDAKLAAAAQDPDPIHRATELREAETLLLKAAPVVPLYYNTHTFLLQPSVHGWYPTLLDHHPYKAVWLEP